MRFRMCCWPRQPCSTSLFVSGVRRPPMSVSRAHGLSVAPQCRRSPRRQGRRSFRPCCRRFRWLSSRRSWQSVGGTQYTFTFDAKYSASAVSASSSLTITKNSPPFGGSLSVSPSEGNAMTTVLCSAYLPQIGRKATVHLLMLHTFA